MKARVLVGPTPLDALEAPDFDLEQRDEDERLRFVEECEHKVADDQQRSSDINATLNGGW